MLRCSKLTKPVELDDSYRELGLTAEASDSQVKAAWRRLSARWHPDRNASPQALQKIQRINRALDEIRRARVAATATCGASGEAHTQATETGPDPEPEPAQPGGAPQAHSISLSLEEAAAGTICTVQGAIEQACSACGGRGQAPEPQPCARCDGRGHVAPPLWFPWMAAPVRCAACDGQGATVVPCACCEGSGKAAPLVYRSRLRIPAGVRDGHHLHARVKLKGRDASQSLEVRVCVRPHEFMVLQEDGTVQLEMPVDGFSWIAGCWIDVPTLYGLRKMRLQRTALSYRIKEAGYPATPSGARADCIVTVVPLFPAQWTERQQALLDALVETNTAAAGGEAGRTMKAWNDRVAAWQERQAVADGD